jgi:hypothetical protein
MTLSTASAPWYRHRWPWFLMLAPATALVVGFYSLWLSIKTADALVADDPYREGTLINQDIRRDEAAHRLGLAGTLALSDHQLRVSLQAGQSAEFPSSLSLQFIHATRAGMDQHLTLQRDTNGEFLGTLPSLPAGRWNVALQDPAGKWRLSGSWQAPQQTLMRLAPLGE